MTSRYTNPRDESKNSILFETWSSISCDKMNLTRIKFFGLFICALCKVQTFCFEKLATSFDCTAKVDSLLRRIQRFMAEYILDTRLIARFIFALLPHKPPYRMTMDRTNCKFRTTDINILVLAALNASWLTGSLLANTG